MNLDPRANGRKRDPLAMRIADTLLASDSATALDRARATRDRYHHAGNIIQTDLFVAVCTIIGLRGATIAGVRAPQAPKP